MSTSRRRKKANMRPTRNLFAGIGMAFAVASASAADNNLLIQLGPDGHYVVWHAEGTTQVSEDEALLLAASATPEGGPPQRIAAGMARAMQLEHGVVIEIIDARTDPRLLVDRDECGAIKLWHSEGATQLSDDQLTELAISALPGGGRSVDLGGRYAKAFVTPLGYSVVIWKPVAR